jgi:cytochrome bd-type quinol oxidase subunit 2
MNNSRGRDAGNHCSATRVNAGTPLKAGQDSIVSSSSYFGLGVDAVVLLIILAFYAFRVGGPTTAASRFRSSNWPWLFREVGLPLGVPVLIGVFVSGGPMLAGWDWDRIPSPLIALAEMTPWTLTFFSITLLCSTLTRLDGKAEKASWAKLSWVALFMTAFYAGLLTIARGQPDWHAGIAPYSGAGFITFFAIWMSHANSRV